MRIHDHRYPHISFMDTTLGKEWHFMPKEDITIDELARLMILFTFSAHTKNGVLWLEYIDDNSLGRHFIETIIGDELPK